MKNLRFKMLMFRPCLLSLLAFLCSVQILLAQLRGKVISISDGDTFTLLTADKKQIKVRLYGIDCPEKKQELGNRAKQFTSQQTYGEYIEVQQNG